MKKKNYMGQKIRSTKRKNKKNRECINEGKTNDVNFFIHS